MILTTTEPARTDHDPTEPSAPRRRRRWPWFVGAVAFLMAIAVAVGLWLFFRGDAPDEVSLDDAIATVETEITPNGDGASATETVAGVADGVVDGVWTIDTETGQFDYEAATGSFAGFRIDEELRSIGSTTAVGRTGDITGSMTIEGTTVTAAEFEIDLTTITTNDSMRDDNVQDALDTGEFPTASFTLTEPIELGDGAADGEAVSVTGVGEMTIHGVTNPIEIAIDAQLVDDLVVAVGSMDMTFSDFGVTVPDGGPVISVDDAGVVEFQFLLRR
ncbi:MAG: YceI family protein [Actinomycetota bacterium]